MNVMTPGDGLILSRAWQRGGGSSGAFRGMKRRPATGAELAVRRQPSAGWTDNPIAVLAEGETILRERMPNCHANRERNAEQYHQLPDQLCGGPCGLDQQVNNREGNDAADADDDAPHQWR